MDDLEIYKRRYSREKQAREEAELLSEQLIQQTYSISEQLRTSNDNLRHLSDNLSKYLPSQVFTSISNHEVDAQLTSKRKFLTVFFADIVRFTVHTETEEAEVLAELLNDYLQEMSVIANEYGATIDKFIGDALVAFFGDPDSKGEKGDALSCVHMAIEMRRRMNELRHKWTSKGFSHPLHMRMGINSGHCTVGNFGSDSRMDYTAIGAQVNLANRVQSEANADDIFLTHSTYTLIKDDIYCDPLGEKMLKGFFMPTKVYRVVKPYDEVDHGNSAEEATLVGLLDKLDPPKMSTQTRIKLMKFLYESECDSDSI